MSRILIVEDEQPLREAFAFLLKTQGYEVEMAENGKVGIEKLKGFKPDLIMLDMLMPIMDGLKFLQAADFSKHAPEPKIMMLSNLPNPLSAEEVKTYGVAELLTKASLSPKDLIAAVKKQLATKAK